MVGASVIGIVAVAIWLYLLLGRGGFWRASVRDNWSCDAVRAHWPSVAVLVPARNEAAQIAPCLNSLLAQDYPGAFSIDVIDDNSTDGTATLVRALAQREDAAGRLRLIEGSSLPEGWTGKLWALRQGFEAATSRDASPVYVLFTDADIIHAPDLLRRLVDRAQAQQLVLLSLMAKLRCKSLAERALVPAFVFFFQMLYPFRWVRNPASATAAAAGGCLLVQAEALRKADGIAAIRRELIDDCALARRMKTQGRIELALTERVRSVRAYPSWADLGGMISRSAFAQLHYSWALLLAVLAGLTLTFLAPPLLVLATDGPAQLAGLCAWVLMALLFQPMLRFYRLSPLWGVALPLIALTYAGWTLHSALQYSRGRGGAWKGRTQSVPT
jgi:hopene-associated glycosyltransferase HpnB